VEFGMAGTLLLLRQAGWETHLLTLASGNCGNLEHDSAATRTLRWRETRQAARILGAQAHPSLTDDLEVLYDLGLLRRLAAVVREVQPAIILTHSPQDYMEDHMTAGRLAVTAAFAHGMPNFKTRPARPAFTGDLAVYHAMPHGLCDGLRRPIRPEAFANTTAVHATKRQALAAHLSQKAWLDASQGMDSYLHALDEMSLTVGTMSGKFQHAEGWRRRLHLGFASREIDPLREALGSDYLVDTKYKYEIESHS
jgi:LmbE family N-acetylglucosaminyl deacetylase